MFRAFFGLVKKEFRQVFRDPAMLRIILVVPVIQLIVLGYAVRVDVQHIATDVYDFDRSQLSREFVSALDAGEYFVTNDRLKTTAGAHTGDIGAQFQTGAAEMAVVVPEDFSERISTGHDVTIGILADGADANAARTGLGYASQIVQNFSRNQTGLSPPLELRHKMLYNPESESVFYMVPGIVVSLLTMITVLLTSMAIVREREVGTLEQLLVTPISKFTLLMGKVSTFAILGMVEMTIALLLGLWWFDIPFAGSFPLFFALAALYLLTTLGIGIFFSTITSTQQQAMFYAWFFTIFALLTSGFFTPISNMPQSVQYLTYINPMRYFMVIVRGILMKGAGIADLWPNIVAIAVYGLAISTIAVSRFQKRTA